MLQAFNLLAAVRYVSGMLDLFPERLEGFALPLTGEDFKRIEASCLRAH